MPRQMMEDSLKATVISLFPMEIADQKPGLYPGYYVIPAAPLGDVSFLVVGDAVFYQETKNDQMLTVKTPFHVLAESIVHDFMTSHIGRIVGVAEPGLFWRPGAYRDIDSIKYSFADDIAEVEEKQLKWFEQLVSIADDTYSHTRRHNSVSKLQRLAAQRLGVQRPWVIKHIDAGNMCPFCRAETPFGAVKCPTCREIVDMKAYKELVGEMQGEAEAAQ